MGTVFWSYLGWRRFPNELSAFEIDYFFTFSAADRRQLRRRFRTRLRLAAALQLGFVRMTGATLDAIDHVPRAVLKHLGTQLKLAAPELATLRAWYKRPRTLFHHQAWACWRAGFRWPDMTDEASVVEDLIAACSSTLDKDRLVRVAQERLFQHKCLIPRRRAIEDWVRRAIRLVEVDDRRLLDRAVPRCVREAWLTRLLAPHTSGRMTMLEWVRRPPRRRSPKTLKEEVAKLCFIHSLSPPGKIQDFPRERLRAYDRRMARRRPAKVRQISEPRRTLEIAAVLSVLATCKSDTVLRLVEMRIAAIWRWAYSLQRAEPISDESEAIARELAATVDDFRVSAEEYREHSRVLLAPWCRDGRRIRPTRARRMREYLAVDRHRIRPLIKLILRLGLQGLDGDPVVRALRELADVYEWAPAELHDGATAPVGHAWNKLIANEDRVQALRAYEAATLWAIRRGLRNGSLWLPYADQYGGRHRLVLPDARWEMVREDFQERRGLPSSAGPFMDRLMDQVDAGLQAVAVAADTEALYITDSGRVILNDHAAMKVTRKDAAAISARLYAQVGKVQLPELLLAMDSETHFTWQLLGRIPTTAEELLPLYAAIIAAAMGLDATEVCMMIPAVRPSSIRRASRLLEDDRLLRRANDAVLEYLLAHPLSHEWGDGFEASSDLMSLDVSRHLWLSRVDPKRRRHAVGTYTHVFNRWGILYDQPLLLSTRQAGAAIEGAVRQSVTRLERLAVDTHGYSDFALAIAKLLGFDLCPRLSSLRDRRLHVPRRVQTPGSLAKLLRKDVPLAPIREGWDDLLRVAATIEEGWRSATNVLERFGSAARGDQVHRAGHALGQLLRTVYLCDYFTLPDFRQSVGRILDRGESVHALQRQICSGTLPVKRGRRKDGWKEHSCKNAACLWISPLNRS